MVNSQSNLVLTPPSALNSASALSTVEDGARAVHGATTDRVNILGIGAMPLDLGKAVATLERWRVEGRRV